METVNSNIAFVFPGQGSQFVGMGKEIHDHFDEAKNIFREASDTLGYDVGALCFDGPREELNKTSKTQPCILTVSMALYRAILHEGLKPSVVAGHSLGEYSALVAAGVFSFRDAVHITEKRGQFMQEAVPEGKGLMAAILGLDKEKVEQICSSLKSGYAAPANYNCPGQIVIAGEKEAVEEALEKSKISGAKRAIPLAVSVPSHCRLMEKASEQLSDLLETIDMKNPEFPLVNNADARFLTNVPDIKTSLKHQLNFPLLWEDSIKALSDSGITTFIEVGPGKVLSGLVKRILPDGVVLNVSDMESFKSTLMKIKG